MTEGAFGSRDQLRGWLGYVHASAAGFVSISWACQSQYAPDRHCHNIRSAGLCRCEAGRRFSPYALLEHTGRRSGRAYLTPVGAFPFGDGFIIGLSYGADVDWCRNITASGHAIVKWRAQEFVLERPEIIPMSRAVLQALPPYFPLPARELRQFVWLHRPSPVNEPAPSNSDASHPA